MKFVVIFILITKALSVLSGTECDAFLGSDSPLPADLEKIQIKLINQMHGDISRYCKMNRFERFGRKLKFENPQAYNKLIAYLKKGEIEQAEKILVNYRFEFLTWAGSMSGSHKIKSNIFKWHSVLFNQFNFSDLEDLKKWIDDPNRETLTKSYVEHEKLEDFSMLSYPGAALLTFLGEKGCKGFSNINQRDCLIGLKQTWKIFNPKTVYVGNISLPIIHSDLYKEILENPKYKAPLLNLAKKLISNYEQKTAQPSHLDKDIRESFRESGLKGHELEDMTWNVLGLLSMGGPSLGLRLTKIQSNPVNPEARIALTAVADLIPLLDSKNIDQNSSLYSLPAEMNLKCDFGKTYHFWFSAYLAKKLALSNLDKESSAAAIFVLSTGYQLFAGGSGWRDPSEILNSPRFGVTEVGVRMDQILAASGVLFGTKTNMSLKINLEEEFINSIKLAPLKSNPNFWERISNHLPSSYVENWMDIYKPYEVFHNMKVKIRP